jgi:DNA-binding NtrC family response regulator
MADSPKILVIEGDEALAEDLIARLEHKGFKPQLAKNRSQASALLRCLRFDAVLSDVRLPDGDGEKMFQDALPFLRSTPIIFTSAAGDVDQAVRLVKAGAADYLQKPYDIPTLIERLQGMVTQRPLPTRTSWPEPTVVSPAMRDLGILSERLAATNISALVTGESGSGKEVLVRHLHRQSSRAAEPFILVACAGLACADGERLLFGELFRSSNDNRYELRTGALEEAGCGTLFLDEVHEMPPALQSRLVQVIDDRRFRRVTSLRCHSRQEFWPRRISAAPSFANGCAPTCFIASPWSNSRSRRCGIGRPTLSHWSNLCCGIWRTIPG